MNKLKEDIYTIDNDSITVSTMVKNVTLNNEDLRSAIKDKLVEEAKVYDELINLLLVLRGKAVIVRDGGGETLYTKEDMESKILDLKRDHNIQDIPDEDFISLCKDFFELYVGQSKFRAYANVLLSKKKVVDNCLLKTKKVESVNDDGETIETKIVEKDFTFLRRSGIFPVNCDTPVKTQYGINAGVYASLSSFHEKQKKYDEKKKNYENLVVEKMTSSSYSRLEEYGRFLEGIRSLKGYEGFKVNNFKKFITLWRGRYDKETQELKKEGMRHEFIKRYQENPDQFFTQEEKHLFGHDASFMNYLFHDCRNLWEEFAESADESKDIIGNQDYVSIAIENYHWLKESVAVPLSTAYGKLPRIYFGNNFTPFNISVENGEIQFTCKSFFDNKEGEIQINISSWCKNGLTPEIDEIYVTKKDKHGNEKKCATGNFRVRYSRDSKSKTWYTGVIKQPWLRWNEKKNVFVLDLPISSHREENTIVDEDLKNNKYFFMSAPKNNSKAKEKREYVGDNDVIVMGVDFGIHTPISSSAIKYNMIEDTFKVLGTEKSTECVDVSDKLEFYRSVNQKIDLLKCMIDETFSFVCGKSEEIKGVVYKKNKSYAWASKFKINVLEYEKFIKSNIKPDIETTFCFLRKKSSGWEVGRILSEINKEVKKIKGHFWHHVDRSEKGKNNIESNFVDRSFFEKRSMVKNMISLKKKFSCVGKTSSENAYITNNFDKDLHDWYVGLTRHSALQIAAVTLNMARKYGAKYVFIEDLDSGGDSFSDKEENKLKSLWGCGLIKKAIADKACKHGIVVIEVEPNATSITDPYTGKRGHRPEKDKRTLYVERDGRIIKEDCDDIASINIALRGVRRNSDIPVFKAIEIEDGKKYVVNFNSNDQNVSKRKSGAFYRQFETNAALFENKNGILEIVEKDMTKSRIKKLVGDQKNSKLIINNGGQVYLHEELKKKIEEKFSIS